MTRGAYDVTMYKPEDLDTRDWRGLRELEYEAYRNGGFSDVEAGALVFMGECRGEEQYIRANTHPQERAQNTFRAGQHISEPRIVLAHRGETMLGAMRVALHNTSGSLPERLLKRYVGDGSRDCVWVRSLAVAPGFRHMSIALKISEELFRNLRIGESATHRPVAAYVYEERTPDVAQFLRDHTFERTGEQQTNLGGSALVLARYSAASAQGVSESLSNLG